MTWEGQCKSGPLAIWQIFASKIPALQTKVLVNALFIVISYLHPFPIFFFKLYSFFSTWIFWWLLYHSKCGKHLDTKAIFYITTFVLGLSYELMLLSIPETMDRYLFVVAARARVTWPVRTCELQRRWWREKEGGAEGETRTRAGSVFNDFILVEYAHYIGHKMFGCTPYVVNYIVQKNCHEIVEHSV